MIREVRFGIFEVANKSTDCCRNRDLLNKGLRVVTPAFLSSRWGALRQPDTAIEKFKMRLGRGTS